MASHPPHKYNATVKALLWLRSDFAVLADDPETVEEWVDEFSTHLETVFASGVHIGFDMGEDTQVAAFLWDVVAGIEEELHPASLQDDFALLLEYSQRVKVGTMSKVEFEVHKLCVLTVGQRPHSSASPALTVVLPPSPFALSPSALGASAVLSSAASPLLSVVLPPSSQPPSLLQPFAPSPAASGTSAPLLLLFSKVAPSVPGPSASVTAPPSSQRPI
ncbi:hypothetical protein BJY52DRAFT_1187542 [Lactarius psammicola]|nr:hypothetical protein BJY52DRAFT_1187542 [Lactarius psammicola]